MHTSPAANRIDWPRLAAITERVIESQDDNRPGAEKLRDATAIVCRELGVPTDAIKVVEFVESTVQGLFERWKAKRAERNQPLDQTVYIADYEKVVAERDALAAQLATSSHVSPQTANDLTAVLAEVTAERDALTTRLEKTTDSLRDAEKKIERLEKKAKKHKGKDSDGDGIPDEDEEPKTST